MNSNHVQIFQLDQAGGSKPKDLGSLPDDISSRNLLWCNIQLNGSPIPGEICELMGLDDFVLEALTAEETRPRILAHEDGLIAILRGVNLNPGAEPDDMVSVRVWLTPNQIVTTRKRSVQSLVDLQTALENRTGPTSSGDFLAFLADRLTYRIGTIIDNIEDNIADLEERSLSEDPAQIRNELIRGRRETVGLRRYLAPMREAMLQLLKEKILWLEDGTKLQLREITDRVVRLVEDLDLVRERSILIQEELTARLSDEFNKRLYLLSIVAAIFLPLSFLTGLLGINVGGIPGAEFPWAFATFIGILILIFIGQYRYFKSHKWL